MTYGKIWTELLSHDPNVLHNVLAMCANYYICLLDNYLAIPFLRQFSLLSDCLASIIITFAYIIIAGKNTLC